MPMHTQRGSVFYKIHFIEQTPVGPLAKQEPL